MKGISFEVDLVVLLFLILLAFALFFLLKWRKEFLFPYLAFSSLLNLKQMSGKKAANIRWSRLLQWVALSAFATALLDPRMFFEKKHAQGDNRPLDAPTEGIAIYLVLDQSGSMKEEIPIQLPGKIAISKIDLLRQLTKEFIQGDASKGLPGRPNDLIGLIFFARGATVKSPLTLDHLMLQKQLETFKPIGERDQDGTSIGYAIFKTVNLIASTRHYAKELLPSEEAPYDIKNSVIILITDGMQDPNPLDKGKRLRNMDVPEAAAYAKAHQVRLYIVNVEPKLATEEFAPYRHIMQRAAELTGGKFYMIDTGHTLDQIYHDIDQLERSSLPQQIVKIEKDKRPDLFERFSFYPYLIALGMLAFVISILIETVILRRVP